MQRKMLIKEQRCRLPFTSFDIGRQEAHFAQLQIMQTLQRSKDQL